MQIVFQNPYLSLNPMMKIGEIIAEPMIIHGIAKGENRRQKVLNLLAAVGLLPAEQFIDQLSSCLEWRTKTAGYDREGSFA